MLNATPSANGTRPSRGTVLCLESPFAGMDELTRMLLDGAHLGSTP
ncbi:MAG: hypothetical protein ABI893_03775 [Polaromonas sp.]